MQTLHYLTLSIITPPLLAAFAETASLNYEGGAASVGMFRVPGVRNISPHPRTRRNDYGLAGDGWEANSYWNAHWREVVGLEWWQESWLWVERRPMGWKHGPNAGLDYRCLLDGGVFSRVRRSTYLHSLKLIILME